MSGPEGQAAASGPDSTGSGQSPLVQIEGNKIADQIIARQKQGDNKSTCPANCHGEACCGTTAPADNVPGMRSVDPTFRQWLNRKVEGAFLGIGAEQEGATRAANFFAGTSDSPGVADFVPGLGSSLAASDSKDAFANRRYFKAGISAIAIFPLPIAKLAKAAKVGEPVAVASGEYLETWYDFTIPADLPFDGSRHMALKLPQPVGHTSPLGVCQISAVDEIVANPQPGRLIFHQADGKVIHFKRPFNFLPSMNAGCPHIELTAPWLKRLELRDRTFIKHFRQYDDNIYRLERIENTNGNVVMLHRNAAGVLERASGTNGLELAFSNDTDGHRTRIVLIGIDGSRLELARYAYDARGRMTAAECAFGMSIRYYWHTEHDLLMRWHNVTRRSQTHFTYDDEGRVLHTRTNGIWNDDRFRYDPDNRETTYLPSGNACLAQRFRYDENDNVTHEIDAFGHTIQRTYDAVGFETSITDANGHATTMTYDIRGNVKRHIDAEGRNTTYGWGPYGELDTIIDGAGHIRRYDNDEKGNCRGETDAEGHNIRYVRDERGRLLRTIFADGAEERRGYDAHGRLASVTDARGGVTRFARDPFGRVTETIDALGHVTRAEYAGAAGGFSMPSAIVRPDGVRIRRTFTEDGLLASVTDGEGRTWRYSYGAFDVLQAIEDPGGGRLSFAYDGEGRITAVTNQVGVTYHLIRDAAGRVVAEEDFDGRRTEYARDPGGRVIETKKSDGTRLVYRYDKTDKLTSIRSYAADAGSGAGPLDETHFWYDRRGLLIKASNLAALVEFEHDGNGRIVRETVNGRTVESKRDVRGNRIERCIGDALVKIGRDPLGAVASLTIDDHVSLAFSRDASGREIRRATEQGFRLEQVFDPLGQLMRQSAGGNGQAGRSYAWDKAGAPTLIDDRIFGPAAYSYDANGQVARATFGETLTERFDYDAARNVVGVSVGGQQIGADLGALLNVRSTPGGVVQLSQSTNGETVALTHDICGRVVERRVERKGFRPRTWRYGWDAQDHLVTCITPEGERWFYGYDPFGRRLTKVKQFSETERDWVAKKHPSLVSKADREGTVLWTWPQVPNGHAEHDPRPPVVGTHFLWDGDVIAEEASLRLDGGVDWDAATRWYYEPESFVPPAKQTPDKGLAFIVTDHLGTPREMFDQSGQLRWAASLTTWGVVARAIAPKPANDDKRQAIYPRSPTYGNLAFKPERAEDIYDCPIRFQGQWADRETGFYYNRFRHYDPIVNQYASTDPIGLSGGSRPYSFSACPTLWIDPLGLTAMQKGVSEEAERLGQLGLPKDTDVFRPSESEMDSATFKAIVGDPKFTKGGIPKGTIFDSTKGGHLEIKRGTSPLDSTYQLRLQTYRSVTKDTPFTIETTRPVNPTFQNYLSGWGVSVTKPP